MSVKDYGGDLINLVRGSVQQINVQFFRQSAGVHPFSPKSVLNYIAGNDSNKEYMICQFEALVPDLYN